MTNPTTSSFRDLDRAIRAMPTPELEAMLGVEPATDRIWQCRRDPSHPLLSGAKEPRCSVCGDRCEPY